MRIRSILWKTIPAHNRFLYFLCKHYVDRHNGDNNGNIVTNGELRLMRSVLPNCEVVFDVGANVGDWAALALEIRSDLKIHCFEPSAATFRHLTARNFGDGVVCNNFGFSSATREAHLQVYEEGSGLNSLYVRRGLEDGLGLATQSQTEIIRVETLDGYCQRAEVHSIDFLKIDVEGHELEVLKGAIRMLSRKAIRHIQFEYGGCNIDSRVLLKDIFDLFASYGYALYKLLADELRHVSRYDQRLENYQYQNWLAMAPDVNGSAL
jgi:FkbM family methyltransferase